MSFVRESCKTSVSLICAAITSTMVEPTAASAAQAFTFSKRDFGSLIASGLAEDPQENVRYIKHLWKVDKAANTATGWSSIRPDIRETIYYDVCVTKHVRQCPSYRPIIQVSFVNLNRSNCLAADEMDSILLRSGWARPEEKVSRSVYVENGTVSISLDQNRSLQRLYSKFDGKELMSLSLRPGSTSTCVNQVTFEQYL